MKIAYLSRGNNVYDRRFLEKMVERGHEAYFISYYPCQRVEVEGVKTFHYDYLTMHRFGRFLSLQTALHLRRLLNQIQPDVLHTGWIPDHGLFGALSCFHPTLSMPWGSDILIETDLSPFLKWSTWFILKRADMITCDCELVKNKIIELSGYPGEKIIIFPWGIDLNVFRPLNRPSRVREKLGWEDKKILIMNRNFKPVYGIEYFVEALPTIIQARPDTRVILAGNGPTLPECKKRVAELGLTDCVYFAGFLGDQEMAEYLNACDIYVTTSLSDGTSCSMLEAMACGLPVVVSDAPAYFEWVEDGVNGYIVPRRNSNVLATLLLGLLSDEALRHEMGQRNLKIARERANWEKNFHILEDIYLVLTQGRNLRK
jgi:glycosyltransferase involved in cell wall biosynthesis